jgi:hypothetical protein
MFISTAARLAPVDTQPVRANMRNIHTVLFNHDQIFSHVRLPRLPEGNPESVAITNDEFTHIVECIVKAFDDLDLVFKVSVQVIDVVRRYVEVDLATVIGARFPAYIEHQFAVSKGQLRPVDFAVLLVLSN